MKSGDGRLAGLPWACWGAAALAACGLKHCYSRATVEELGWILAPTARTVGWLLGETLGLIPGSGWAPPDGAYVIAKGCAGVNFLILALAVSVFGFAHRLRPGRARLLGFLGALAGAWVLTVVVNTLRIVAAVELYRVGPVAGLSPAALHRLLGIVVYLGALWGLHWALDRLTAGNAGSTGTTELPSADVDVVGAPPCGRPLPRSVRRAATGGRPYVAMGASSPLMLPRPSSRRYHGRGTRFSRAFLVPALYLGVTVVVPLLHAAFRGGDDSLAEHAMIVASVTLLSVGAVALAKSLRHRPWSGSKCK